MTEDAITSAAAALGRLGGLKGGKALAAKRSPDERSRAARYAAQKRWGTTPPRADYQERLAPQLRAAIQHLEVEIKERQAARRVLRAILRDYEIVRDVYGIDV